MLQQSTAGMLKRLLVLAVPFAPVLALSTVMAVGSALAAVLLNVVGINAVYQSALGKSAVPLLMFAVLLAGVRSLFRYVEQLSGHYLAFRVLAVLRNNIFRALRRTAPAKLEGRKKGELITLITTDIELLEVFYAHTIVPVITAVVVSIVLICFLWYVHPLMGILAAIAYFLSGILLPAVNGKIAGAQGDQLRERLGKLSAEFLEKVRGIDVIIRSRCGVQQGEEVNVMSEAISKVSAKLKRNEGIAAAMTDLIITLFTALAFIAAIWLVQRGKMDIQGLLIAVSALLSSFGPTAAIGNLSHTLANTFASGRRVLALLDEVPTAPDITGQREPKFTGAALDLVSFAYERQPVLAKCSAVFGRDSIIGIEGKSGSGKSTLLKLLMRFWEVGSGRVSVSGEDIDCINTAHLRKLEGYMTQETFLFHDTLLANIKIGKLDATDEEVMQAAKQASLHDFIMELPQGYYTDVGELGSRLSGGERQRIGLARIFLCGAPLLLLDEPTSNLDSLNEAVILRSIRVHSRDKTVVLVSHREKALSIASYIYKIKENKNFGSYCLVKNYDEEE